MDRISFRIAFYPKFLPILQGHKVRRLTNRIKSSILNYLKTHKHNYTCKVAGKKSWWDIFEKKNVHHPNGSSTYFVTHFQSQLFPPSTASLTKYLNKEPEHNFQNSAKKPSNMFYTYNHKCDMHNSDEKWIGRREKKYGACSQVAVFPLQQIIKKGGKKYWSEMMNLSNTSWIP